MTVLQITGKMSMYQSKFTNLRKLRVLILGSSSLIVDLSYLHLTYSSLNNILRTTTL